MRLAVALLTVLVAASQVRPNPVPLTKAAPPNYYPLQEGRELHFQADVNGQASQFIIRVAKEEVINGQRLYRLDAMVNGQEVASEHISSTDKGIFRHRANGIEVTPPVCLLRYPVKKGDRWEAEVSAGQQKLKVSCEVDRESVEVPAGKFQAVTSEVRTEVNGIQIHSRYWFAPNVGMVKQTIDIGGQKTTLELNKIVPGK